MFDKSALSGIIPPTFLPVTENGSFDKEAMAKVVQRYISAGVRGILILGTVGEGAVADTAMSLEAFRFTREEIAGRIPLLAGVIETSTPRAIEWIKAYEQEGADFILATPPCYFANNNQCEVIRHYELLARSTSVPMMCYNIPSHTRVVIAPETFIDIAAIDGMVGFKNSTDDWMNIQHVLLLRQEKKADFRLFVGNEEYFALAMMMGADGAISGGAAIFPEKTVAYYEAIKSLPEMNIWKHPEIIRMMSEMMAFSKLPGVTTAHKKAWVSAYKSAFAYSFGIGNTMLPPIDQPDEDELAQIRGIVDKINGSF